MKNTAYLALGSNLGDRQSVIKSAVEAIEKNTYCCVKSVSSLYETSPFGYADQDNFINAVISIETELSAFELFDFIKEIEYSKGRKERFKWGPRELDIDILFFNHEVIETENLRIPHKGIISRDFVLVPLAEIEPDLIHPELDQKISDICKSIKIKNIIRKI